MATGKKYYWIKLKKDFLTGDTVDFLMGQKNGAEYVVLYQMLCLMCINTEGKLARKIGEIIVPFDIDKIQRDCKYFNRDTVTIALELFKRLGLVYEQSEGGLVISDFADLVGSETDYAVQKRVQRQSRGQLMDKDMENVHTEKEIRERDIEKEIRDKSSDKDTDQDTDQDTDKNKKEVMVSNKKKGNVFYPNDEVLNQAFADYVDMRKKIKAPMTDRAITLAMNNLKKLSVDSSGNMDNELAIKILEQSIFRSWKGLFPLKDDSSGKGSSSGNSYSADRQSQLTELLESIRKDEEQ